VNKNFTRVKHEFKTLIEKEYERTAPMAKASYENMDDNDY
jgi:hypothetical protein